MKTDDSRPSAVPVRRMAKRQGMDRPGRPINEVLVAIHEQWIDKTPPEQLDADLLAIPGDFPQEIDADHPPLM